MYVLRVGKRRKYTVQRSGVDSCPKNRSIPDGVLVVQAFAGAGLALYKGGAQHPQQSLHCCNVMSRYHYRAPRLLQAILEGRARTRGG